MDNCYGEFTQMKEPCQAGADLVVGSLIKNPGGGIAPTGGYIAGRKDLVELCAYRLNAPGLGKELGCTLETPRDMYLGFYYAPGVVCEAIKTAIYAQCLLELVGKKPIPRYCEDHNDIVTPRYHSGGRAGQRRSDDRLLPRHSGRQPRGQLCRTGTLSGAGLYR